MKKKFHFILSSFFLIGTLFSVGYLVQAKNFKQNISLEAHADWPTINFDEMMLGADLVAIVKIDDIKNEVQETENGEVFERQYSTLKVKKVIKGEEDKNIVLNQAINHVEKNGKYIMFLRKGTDGYYYELTDVAIAVENQGIFKTLIPDLKGEFSEEELISLLQKKKNELTIPVPINKENK